MQFFPLLLALGLANAFQPACQLRPACAVARAASPVCALPLRRFRKEEPNNDDEVVAAEVLPESPADAMKISVDDAAQAIKMPMPEVKLPEVPDVDVGKTLDDIATGAVKGIDAVAKFDEEYKVVETTKGAFDSTVAWAKSDEAAETFESTMAALDNAKKWGEENEVGLKARAIFEMGFEGLKAAGAAMATESSKAKKGSTKKPAARMKPKAKPAKKAPSAKKTAKKGPTAKKDSPPKKFGFF